MSAGLLRRQACAALACAALACAALDAATAQATAPRQAGSPAFQETAASPQTLQQLRAGGYVLYMRHGPTDNSRTDAAPMLDYADCSSQRVLNDEGRQIAAQVGAALRQAAIPIGEIRLSPLCRTRQTFEAAFGRGRAYIVDAELRYTANLSSQEKQPILAQTRRLLSAPVAPGSNRLLIAHGSNLADLIGYFPKEGTLVVFRPRGDAGFDYVASIVPARWPELLRSLPQP